MQDNLKAKRNPLLRKIVTLAFLPIIIFIWVTGWILTQIGDQGEPSEISQKSLQTHLGFKAYAKESEVADEDSRIVNEPQIVA